MACPYAHRATLAACLCPVQLSHVTIPTTNQFGYIDRLGITERSDVFGSFNELSVEELKEIKRLFKAQVNSSGEVPALLTPGGTVIVESEVVAEYLDSISGSTLLPRDPVALAKMRIANKRFNQVPPAMVQLLKNQVPANDEALALALDDALTRFVSSIDAAPGFCIGTSCTLADVHAAPFIFRFGTVLKHYRGESTI